MLRGPPGGSLENGNVVERAQKDVHRLGPYCALAQIRAQGVNLHIADACDAHQAAVFPGQRRAKGHILRKDGREKHAACADHKRGIGRGNVAANQLGVDLDEFAVEIAFDGLIGRDGHGRRRRACAARRAKDRIFKRRLE